MTETVQTAPEQPAQVAQTSSETEHTGKQQVSDLSRKLAGRNTPYSYEIKSAPVAAPVEAKVTPEVQAASTEEAKAPSAEVKEPETEAKAETAEETDTEEVPSHETQSLDPKLQERINRRIGKEVGKTKKAIERAAAAEARAAELESRLAQQPQEVEKEIHVPVPANVPLAEITSLDQLNTYRENLENDIVEAEMLLYSEFPPEGLDTKWGKITKPALIAALTQAKKDARTAVPAREKFLTTSTQSRQTAHEKFPFLKDRTHPGYAMAQQALRDNPVLHAYPNKDYLVGMMVKGQLAMQAEEAGKAPEAKAPAVKPRPKPTSGQSEIASDASPTRAPVGIMGQQALQVERARIAGGKNTIGQKGLAALLQSNARYRNSQ